jgi:hypothetical protein
MQNCAVSSTSRSDDIAMRRSSAQAGNVNKNFSIDHLVITRVRICTDGAKGQSTRKLISLNAVAAGKARIHAGSPRG